MTIAEAAAEVLRDERRPLTLEAILELIKSRNLYEFNSPDELTILREQVRRHCELPDKKLQYEPILFNLDTNGLFNLLREPMTQRKITMRRIRRASDKEEIIERLAKKSDSLFVDIWKLLVFAATVGLQAKKREPVAQFDSGKTIDFTYFSGCPAWPGLMHLIGLVESQDPRVLNPDQDQLDYRISLFEEYANAGLRILCEAGEPRDYSLDSILGLIPSPDVTAASSATGSQI
jgi:dnd system-associated protein 4